MTKDKSILINKSAGCNPCQGHRDAVEAGTLQRIYKPSGRADGYAW